MRASLTLARLFSNLFYYTVPSLESFVALVKKKGCQDEISVMPIRVHLREKKEVTSPDLSAVLSRVHFRVKVTTRLPNGWGVVYTTSLVRGMEIRGCETHEKDERGVKMAIRGLLLTEEVVDELRTQLPHLPVVFYKKDDLVMTEEMIQELHKDARYYGIST